MFTIFNRLNSIVSFSCKNKQVKVTSGIMTTSVQRQIQEIINPINKSQCNFEGFLINSDMGKKLIFQGKIPDRIQQRIKNIFPYDAYR